VKRQLGHRRFHMFFVFVVGCLAGPGPLNSETPAFQSQVEQWGIQEVVLRSGHAYGNFLKEVEFQCRFRSAGRDLLVAGFYDGNQTWKVRLMPDNQGQWSFETVSNDPELNGKTGSFQVGKPGPDNHGPVRVRGKYHFAYADGTPYFLLGTTAYAWLQSGPRAELRWLKTFSEGPFNKVRFMLLPFPMKHAADTQYPFPETSPGKFDIERFQPEYFQHYEEGIRNLETLGIQADIILFHPYDQVTGFMSMDIAHDEALLKYVVARFGAFRNVWWTMTNEFDLFPIQKDWRRLGELIKTTDTSNHLRGIHNCCTAFYDNSQSWITHVILQNITLQRLASVPRNDAWLETDARKIGKPVVTDEYGYEGNLPFTWGSFSARDISEMHWSITMAGAYGSHGESYTYTRPGAFIGESPARLGFLKQIMTEAPFQEMEPAPDVITKNGDALVMVLGKRGSYYLVHFAAPREVSDWNLGFFGPATPSQPIPLKSGRSMLAFSPRPIPEFSIGDGTFRVDVIDTWNMKVHFLGYTTGPVQKFQSNVMPGVVRLVKVDHAEAGAPTGDVSELMSRSQLH
jgi:Protein of unknown function (DUF4038)/Domain of unknown function (DUF5060)